MAIKASSIPANFWFNAAAIASADIDGSLRSLKSLKVVNTMPEFGLLVKPLMFSPGKATELITPGCSSAIFDISLITSSVRSNDAASGN